MALTISASTITGIGYASIESDAKKESLADLSNKISVEVKSNFKSITKSLGSNYTKNKEKTIQLSSNLPILGAKFKKLVGSRLIKSTATISSTNAIKLYKQELKRLKKEIAHSKSELETTKNDNIKYTILSQLLKDIESFNKHKIVATVLEAKNLPTINVTKSEINIQLQNLLQKVSSLKIAAKLLSKDISQKNIYLSSVTTTNSNEITQFAKILKNELSKYTNTVKYSKDADFFLRGSYEILSNSIFITYKLLNQNNEIIKINTVTLKPIAYKNIKYKPSIKTFDSAINSEFVKSGKLDVQIGFRGYNRANGIDLNAGDTVDIVVKTNKPMCYFLLGHTLKQNVKFSYILPIGSENTPFINSITGEDVNRYISIADEVPIEAPFGSENLQIFASTFDKKAKCPLIVPNCSENEDGYCAVDGKPSKVITKTRALNLKKKKKKIEKAEDSISWTSFKN